MKASSISATICLACVAILLTASNSFCLTQPTIHYNIEVALDTASRTLVGYERIEYVSGADIPLEDIYMHLYANAYRGPMSTVGQEAERNLRDFTLAHTKDSELGYCDIRWIKIDNQPVSYEVDDTSMRLRLTSALLPRDTCIIEISFVTKIPKIRHRFCYQGHHYSIAQWYPKMAVYDHQGWRTDKYHLIGEFYGDFATFDVSITLPQQYYVGATGYLVDAIGGDNNMPHISESKDSVNAKRRKMREDIAAGALPPTKTLTFHEKRVHDFAWVAAPCYVKDEAEWNGVTVTALVFRGAGGKWKHLLEYSLDAIQFWSENIAMYPYSHLTVAEAYSHPNGGMEYPTLSMIDPTIDMPFTNALDIVTAHEIGHNWWYGIIANDELNESWLDEGFNEYYTILYAERKYGEEGVIDLPGVLSPVMRTPYRSHHELAYFLHVEAGRESVVTQSAFNLRDYLDYSTVMYMKGAFTLDMLNYLVGNSVFKNIIHSYYAEFQFSHPTTEDFIRVAEQVSGQELGWFFDQWLRTSKTCDYALGKVHKSVVNDDGDGYKTEIMVERKGEIIMPVDVELKLANGKKETRRIFVTAERELVTVETDQPISSVMLDPEKRLLETDRLNNHSGFLSSVKFAGFLRFGERFRTDKFPIIVIPNVGYNTVDKWKLGADINGGSMTSRRAASIGINYGTDTHKFGFRGWISHRVKSSLAPNGRIGIGFYKDNGMKSYGTHFTFSNGSILSILGGPGLAVFPYHSLSLSLAYADRYDERYFSSEWYSLGKVLKSTLTFHFAERGYHGMTGLGLTLTNGIDLFDVDYSFNKFLLYGRQDFRSDRTGKLVLRLSGRLGYVGGYPPLHEKFHIGAGVPGTTTDPISQASASGGGGVRAYDYEPILGDELYAASLSVTNESKSWRVFKPFAFFDIGRVNGALDSPYLNKALMDAGVGLRIFGIIEFAFPVWVSDPVDDENEFEFRAVVSFARGL